MSWLEPTKSLLLTGLADVRSAVTDEARRPGDRFGLQLMVVSAAAFAAMAAFAKKFLPDTPTQAVVLSRGILMTAMFVTMARRRRVPIVGANPPMLLLRGLLGYAALSCYFWSVQHLPLGDAVLLQYSHPVFVAGIAAEKEIVHIEAIQHDLGADGCNGANALDRRRGIGARRALLKTSDDVHNE
jgi:hypothetical protein